MAWLAAAVASEYLFFGGYKGTSVFPPRAPLATLATLNTTRGPKNVRDGTGTEYFPWVESWSWVLELVSCRSRRMLSGDAWARVRTSSSFVRLGGLHLVR